MKVNVRNFDPPDVAESFPRAKGGPLISRPEILICAASCCANRVCAHYAAGAYGLAALLLGSSIAKQLRLTTAQDTGLDAER